MSTAKGAQAATLDTRKAKDYGGPVRIWLGLARARRGNGVPLEQLRTLVGCTQVPTLADDRAAHLAKALAGPHGLTEQASTFTRRDVARLV